MAKKEKRRLPNAYRAGWDREEVLRRFLAEVNKQAPHVLRELRQDILPLFQSAFVVVDRDDVRGTPEPGTEERRTDEGAEAVSHTLEPGTEEVPTEDEEINEEIDAETCFMEAVRDWITPPNCHADDSVHALAHACCTTGATTGCGTTGDRDASIQRCIEFRGGAECEASQYLHAAIEDCRLHNVSHCLAGPTLDETILHNGEDAGNWPCRTYAPLDDAVRRCMAANAGDCHAARCLHEFDVKKPKVDDQDGDETSAEAQDEEDEDGQEETIDDTDDQEIISLVEATWGWAERHGLVASGAKLFTLASSRSDDGLAPERSYHLNLMYCVFDTLLDWCESPPAGDTLDWAPLRDEWVVEDGPVQFDLASSPDFSTALEEGGFKATFTARHGDEAQYEIQFRADKWQVFSEKRTDAAKRIVEQFRKCLKRMLEDQARMLEGNPDLIKASEKLDEEGLIWLVRFQVLKKEYQELAEEEKLSFDKEKLPEERANAIYKKVQPAAEVLVGPQYGAWLRSRPPGRPTKKGGDDA